MTRTAVVLGVSLLVVLDVVLAVLAWNHVYGDDVGAGVVEEIAGPATAATDGQSPTEPEEGATESEGGGSGADSESTSYDAAVVADGVLARVPVRSCETDAAATMEVSSDGGESFSTVDLPLTGVRRVELSSDSEWVAVGSNRRCEPVARQSGDGGASWQATPVESAGWSLVAEGQIVSPAGEVGTVSCTPSAISGPTEEDAVLLCDDGALLRTENGGSFWAQQATLPRATDVAFLSGADGYALIERGDCGAFLRATTDGGVTWRDLQCLPAEPPAAVAADGSVLVVVTTDEVHRSGDGGQTWEVY